MVLIGQMVQITKKLLTKYPSTQGEKSNAFPQPLDISKI